MCVMGILWFFFLLTMLFSGAAGWAYWEWRSGRTEERPMWHRVFHYCLVIAFVLLMSYFMAVVTKYHLLMY